MHLIAVLACGVAGAENGYAELYRRSTSTRATWYTGFDATGANSSGANITLDSYGGAVVYVDEHVDVIVKASDGTTIRSFTSSAAAPAVEVISQSFTGVDYDDAESGASRPVPLDTVLDRWKTSAGTLDFNVLVGGVSRTLQSLGAILATVYVVKDPQYGAEGDNSTDDTAAIQACITAAAATGGIVYFPPGTYKITSGLTIAGAVDLVGAGASASNILLYHATADILTYSITNTLPYRVAGLSIYPAQANSGNVLDLGAAVKVSFVDCQIGSSTYSDGTLLQIADSATCELTCNRCKFFTAAVAAKCVASVNIAARIRFDDCYFTPATNCTFNPYFDAAWLEMDRCYATVTSNAAHTWLSRGANTVTRLNDTDIIDIGATAGAVTISSASATWFDRGCRLTTLTLSAAVDVSSAFFRSEWRDLREYRTTGGATTDPVTVNATEYGSVVVAIAGVQNFTINLNHRMPAAAEIQLTVVNESGAGSGNITLDSDIQQGSTFHSAVFTVANGDWRTVKLKSIYGDGGGTPTWMQIGDVTAAGVNPA